MRDAIDNRNLEILAQVWNELPVDIRTETECPRQYNERTKAVVLRAMRMAGDEALRGSFSIRVERQ